MRAANPLARQRSYAGQIQQPDRRPTSQEIIRPALVESFSITNDVQNICAIEGLLAYLDHMITWLKSTIPSVGDSTQLLNIVSELSLLSDENMMRQHRELVAHQAVGTERCGVMLAECESMRRMLVGALEVKDSPAVFRSKMLAIIRELRRRKAKEGCRVGLGRQSSGAAVPARRGQETAGGSSRSALQLAKQQLDYQ